MYFSQFVPFRDYIDRTGNHILSMARLAKDVLAEIPDQFLSYMRTRGIKPSPAPPPYTPPGQPLQTQIWWDETWEAWIWMGVEFHLQNTFISLKQLYMPCHLGSRWRLSRSRSCVGQESDRFQHRKSQWKSVYFHCQAFLLVSGLFCLTFCCLENWNHFGE